MGDCRSARTTSIITVGSDGWCWLQGSKERYSSIALFCSDGVVGVLVCG